MTILIILLVFIIGLVGVVSTENISESTIETYQSSIEETFEYEEVDSINYYDYPPVDYSYESFEDYDEESRSPFEIIEEAISNLETHVCLTDDEIVDVYWVDIHAMSYGSFWLKSVTSNQAYSSGDHMCRDYYFEYYDLSEQEISNMKREVDEVVLSIVSNIPDNASDYDKCLIVHDELIRRVTYDHSFEREHRFDLYGTLVYGYGVCSGYASAYCHILKELGIPCQIVDSETHAWNKVGSSYVDVTWDDYDTVDSDGNTIISYYFFGIGDQVTQISDHKIEKCSFNYNPDEYILPYYFEVNDYILSDYDLSAIEEIFSEQMQRGVAMPTVLFSNEAAYEECKARMQTDFWILVSDIGYDGPCTALYQDDTALTWGFN